MKVTQEKLPASQIGLQIEITPEMSKQVYEKTVQNLLRNANVPGFRKGKVPRQVLVQQFGQARLKAAAIEELIEDSLKQAVEQEKIEAIGQFQLKSSFEDLINQFEPGKALTFSAAVDVPPQVTLGEYKGLETKAEEIKYDPAKVDELLETYRNRSATLVPVEGRPSQTGDVAVVDFKGRLTGDAEGEESEEKEIPGGSAEDFEIELTEGKFIPGFVDGIIGMSAGETKEISVTFPETYPQADLAAKPAIFTITLKELKERELPELDDDFAQDVSEFETLAEFRQSLEEQFQKEADEKTRANKEQALLEELVKRVEVELPATLVRQETDYMLTQTAIQLSRQGMDVKRLFTQDLIERMREQSLPEAELRLKRTLALGEIAKRESLKVEAEAIEARIKEIMEDLGDQEVDQERMRQVVEEDLLKVKIFEWLEEHGKVELVPEGSLAPAPEEDPEAEAAEEPASEATVEVAAKEVSAEEAEAAQ